MQPRASVIFNIQQHALRGAEATAIEELSCSHSGKSTQHQALSRLLPRLLYSAISRCICFLSFCLLGSEKWLSGCLSQTREKYLFVSDSGLSVAMCRLSLAAVTGGSSPAVVLSLQRLPLGAGHRLRAQEPAAPGAGLQQPWLPGSRAQAPIHCGTGLSCPGHVGSFPEQGSNSRLLRAG